MGFIGFRHNTPCGSSIDWQASHTFEDNVKNSQMCRCFPSPLSSCHKNIAANVHN